MQNTLICAAYVRIRFGADSTICDSTNNFPCSDDVLETWRFALGDGKLTNTQLKRGILLSNFTFIKPMAFVMTTLALK